MLDDLREKRTLWLECLIGDDNNSIKNQHLRLLWQVAAFRAVNEARRQKYRRRSRNGVLEVNPLLHGLLNECFFECQLLAVRRMTENSGSLRGKRGVWSLIPLLRDIAENCALLTRENLLEVERMIYDYEAAEKAEIAANPARGFRPVSREPFLSRMRHEHIDGLAGVTAKRRSRSDVVREAVLGRLIGRLDQQCQQISKYVDKFVAHAATAESRKTLATSEIKLGQLWKAHQVLHETINFVGTFILGRSNFGGVPHPTYDHLQYLDRALVGPDKMRPLYDHWKRFEKDVHSWEQFDPKRLNAEIRKVSKGEK